MTQFHDILTKFRNFFAQFRTGGKKKAGMRRYVPVLILLLVLSAALMPPAAHLALADEPAEEGYTARIFVDGGVVTVRTAGETVASMLGRAGVTLAAYDEVYPALSAEVTGDADIRVYRVERTEELVFEAVTAMTEYRSADDLVRGQSRVVQRGMDGEKVTWYGVLTREDGQKTYEVLSEKLLVKPVPEIIEVGGGTITAASGEVLSYTKVLEVTATAYTTEGRRHPEKARTATGTVPKVGTIAVDPKVIPYGTKMYVTSPDGTSWIYGVGIAEDTGGGMKGNKIDLFMNTRKECFAHGVRDAKVYILE